jgi:hypothetical protein
MNRPDLDFVHVFVMMAFIISQQETRGSKQNG